MSVHPFRPLPVVREPGPALVEAAACQWCRWSDSLGTVDLLECSHPAYRYKGRAWCSDANPRGECPHHEPSRLTRLLRALRLGRAPAMVDPRMWDAVRQERERRRALWTPDENGKLR